MRGENRRKTCSILTYIRVVEKFPATRYARGKRGRFMYILPPPCIFSLYITTARTFASPVDNDDARLTSKRSESLSRRIVEGVSFLPETRFGHGFSYNGILVSPLGDREANAITRTTNTVLSSGKLVLRHAFDFAAGRRSWIHLAEEYPWRIMDDGWTLMDLEGSMRFHESKFRVIEY